MIGTAILRDLKWPFRVSRGLFEKGPQTEPRFMNRFPSRLYTLMAASFLSFLQILPASAEEVKSPNGQVSFQLLTNGPKLRFEVQFRGNPIVEPSPLGILLDGM